MNYKSSKVMANKRGAKPGERRGGRTAGTPNRGSVLTRERIESLADPVSIMAGVANGEMIDAAPDKDMPGVEPLKVAPTLDQRLMAVRWLGDRVAPVPKTPPIRLDLPKIETSKDAAGALSAVVVAVAGGELSLEQGQGLAALIEAQRKVFETSEIEDRIRRLEEGGGVK